MADFTNRYSGKVCVVTGGATGLGRAIANRLGAENAKISIWDFNESLGATAESELKAGGIDATFTKVNVADEESVKAAFDHTVSVYSKIDVLINCAGIVGPTGLKTEDVVTSDFDKVYNVNLRGSFLVTKYAIPIMKKNDYGRILLIASIAGKEGNAGMSAYSMSKAGVIGFVKAAGKEYAETNITINGLAPAVVRTQMVADMDPQQVKYMTDKIPMKRCGTLEEVAATAAFITSEESSFNTGYCFDLTGGRAVY